MPTQIQARNTDQAELVNDREQMGSSVQIGKMTKASSKLDNNEKNRGRGLVKRRQKKRERKKKMATWRPAGTEVNVGALSHPYCE